MERTPSALGQNTELIDKIIDVTEEQSLIEAGKSKKRVSDVADIQKEQVRDLFGDTDDECIREMWTETEAHIDQAHSERMKSVEETPDAYVLADGGPAGVQHDDTREIGIAAQVLQDKDTAERVSKHEQRHREQEEGDQSFEYENEDGGKVHVRRIAFREKDSITAEGGLNNHTPEYFEYVDHATDVATELDAAGENGQEMVEKAARTVKGFEEVRQKLIENSMRKRLENELKISA